MPVSADKRIGFLIPRPSRDATYRCYQHYRSARALGYDARILSQVTPTVLDEYEVFAFAAPVDPGLIPLGELLRRRGKRIAFDVPGRVFTALYDESLDSDERQMLEYARTFARRADVLTASTEFLVAQCGALGERAFVVPDYIDARIWDVPLPSDRSSFGIPEGAVTIGWAGMEDSFPALRELEPALQKVMEDHPSAYFVTVGDDPSLGALPEGRCVHLGVRGMDEYADFLRHIDVAVIEQPRRFSAECVSDVRVLEHGMAGSAVVLPDARSFRRLREQVPVIPVASSQADWVEHMGRLLLDVAERRRIADALHQHILSSRLLDRNAESVRDAVETLIGLAREADLL